MSLVLALCLPSAALAQGSVDPAPLPANSEVTLVLDQEVSSQRMKVGDAFDVSVAQDVRIGDRVAIPRGARGRGVVAWKTGKGAFGKSGKMEIELRSIEIGGQVVPLTGKYRQEGKGNTAATVGTIVAAGVIAGMFVTGHSAVFAQGMELRGYTAAPFAAVVPGDPVRQQFAATVAPPAPAAVPGDRVRQEFAAAVAPPIPAAAPVDPVRQQFAAVVARPVTAAAPMPALAIVAPPQPTYPPTVAASALRAPLPVIAYATTVSGEDKADQFARLLRAQQGVHGREARQGWTISD